MMPLSERDALNELLHDDLTSFIAYTTEVVSPADPYLENWHIKTIAWHLQKVRNGDITRLIINLPPRHLKSICVLVAFPAWLLGHEPSSRIICASYSIDLSLKHARDCRAIMQSDVYKKIFRNTHIDREKNSESEFMTTKRGFRLATSVGGTFTGRGGNLILIDDPIKPTEALSETQRDTVKQWYDNTLYSRLDNKAKDSIIIIMQRLHVDDLVAHVLEKENWTVLSIPAIAEHDEEYEIGPGEIYQRSAGEVLHSERESLEVLDHIKATIGSYDFAAQYQQNPIPPGGGMIKWKWFQIHEETVPKESNDEIVQSWDTASKPGDSNDFSVCITWLIKGNEYFILDVFRERLNYPDLKRQAIMHAKQFKVSTILIEDKDAGTQLIQELKSDCFDGIPKPIAFQPKGDKVTRMGARSAIIEAGHVFIPERAPWLHDFQREVMQFPRGRFDDQVDSMSQFLTWVKERQKNAPSVVPISFYKKSYFRWD